MLTQGGNTGLVVKPSPGDCLVWPNFGPEGEWCEQSVHSAIPVEGEGRGVAKVVANMWWKGQKGKRGR